MKNYNEVITIEFFAGVHIDEALKEAIELAKKRDCIVEFEFNGIDFCVSQYSDIEELKKMYENAVKKHCKEAKNE